MLRKKKNSRSNMGEQNDNRMTTQDGGNESVESVSGMEADRAERTSGAGTHGDAHAGDEGVDDPAMMSTHRDDMTETPMHGDRLGEGRSTDATESLDSDEMMAAERGMSDQSEMSQRSMRTHERMNDERYDNASDFEGRGSQKEGRDEMSEGTGYTGGERSNTEDSSRGNPLS